MSKTLTKNARWIIFWAETLSDTPLAKPHSLAYNIGRHSYDTPTRVAINNCLDFRGEKILRSMVYEVDVALYPYAKQWEQVQELADRYFNNQLTNPNLHLVHSATYLDRCLLSCYQNHAYNQLK